MTRNRSFWVKVVGDIVLRRRLKTRAICDLKFTSENLKRHLRNDKKYVCTTRVTKKGERGQLFFIDGAGYYVLIHCAEYKSGVSAFGVMTESYYAMEGFNSKDEFAEELLRIYGSLDHKWYVHILIPVRGMEDAEPLIEGGES